MTVVVDLAAPLLPVVGVVDDGSVEGEGGATDVLGVGVPEDVAAEGVGLAGVDPVGVADGELEGFVVGFFCGELLPLSVSPTLVPEA